MGHYYFDSSALAKRYVAERGSQWVTQICGTSSGNTTYTVRITGAEIISALFRRLRSGTLTQADAHAAATHFRSHFTRNYQIVEVSDVLVDLAMAFAEQHDVRGCDSVQLAAALIIHTQRSSLALSPLIFVSADTKLNAAARAEGLAVEDPNNYP